MIRIPRTVVPAAVCLTALALLTACTAGAATTSGGGYAAAGGAGMQMPGMQQGPQMTLAMPQPITANPNDPMKSQLRGAKTFDLGLMLVDGTGYTIYRYDRDTTNPPRSNCNDACAAKWVPVKAGGPAPVDVDQALIGQLTRDDGTQQATLAGWPLYHFTGDSEPADTSGQGAEDAWFPIAPDGKKITLTQDQWRENAFGL